MKETRMAAIYARVSTCDKGQDPMMQTRELRDYCKRRNWRLFNQYIDHGYSGAKDSRPALDRLLRDAHRKRFDVVIVWKFDRFARSVSHLLHAFETFRALGIEFVSLSEQLDTATPAGKLVFTILGAVSELERAVIAERVRAGIRNARANGIRIGRPPLRSFSDEEIRAIRAARRKERVSVRQLAKQYGTTQWMIQKLAKAA
jgi:DNA invertase Pin-like site-specific DNA recombinase